jgi:hypothetical protein
MNYCTEYGDDLTRRVPKNWSEALGHATDRLRMVPKGIYECPDELVRVFLVANEILAQVINDLGRAHPGDGDQHVREPPRSEILDAYRDVTIA